jgi:hypothetical protein
MRGALADDHHAVLHAALGQFLDRVGKDIEALFHDQTAQETHHHLIIGNAQRPAPGHVTAPRIEHRAVHAPRPQRDVIVHPLVAQNLRKAFEGATSASQRRWKRRSTAVSKGSIQAML